MDSNFSGSFANFHFLSQFLNLHFLDSAKREENFFNGIEKN
jgi:hypothetical protein